MSSKLMMRLLLVIMVVCGAVWLSFAKPTKLGLDLKGGVYVVLEAVPEEGVTIDSEAMDRLIEVLDRRINGLGVAESVVQKAGDRKSVV